MAIREELTLGLSGWKTNLDKARNDVRQFHDENRRGARGGLAALAGYTDKGADGVIGTAARAVGPAVVAMAAFRTGIEAVSIAMERQRAEMALGAVSTEDVGDQLDRLRELGESPGLGFDQVVAASTRLQAVGISAASAEKAIKEMGNALALVGGGKEQLDGVMLAMTQIVAKGVVSAEEINQIAERLPQIRALMQEAFGTADTETLQKMGIGSEEFIEGIIDAASGLERATTTSSEALSNLLDDWKDFLQTIGDLIEPAMKPLLGGMSALLEKASEGVRTVAAVHGVASATLFGTDGKAAIDYLGGGNFKEASEELDRKNRARMESGAAGKTGSELAAEKKAAEEQAKQLALFEKAEAEGNRDAARRREAEEKRKASEQERAATDAARARENVQGLLFDTKGPEEQMRILRDRIEKSLGMSGTRDEIIAAADLRSRGGDPYAAQAALQDLAQLEAIAGRMPVGAGSTGAVGSFAGLMDQIFGRGTPEQQLDEMRRANTLADDTNRTLDAILIKMEEPPEVALFEER
jgi:tape measure domain-containing protein